nr:hypothetical protein [uncultured Mediterranean phage uvMED]
MYIGSSPTIGNFQVCDAISVVNGQASYTMQVSSVNVVPQSANHMLVSLNGILQKPNSSFTVSGSTITFASNLVTGDVIDFIQILGSVLDLGVPSDNTVSLAKLTATGTKSSSTFLRGDNTFAEAGGGGKINQVLQATNNTQQDLNSSSSFVDLAGVTQAITPSATSSKILIISDIHFDLTAGDRGFQIQILRDSTVVFEDGNNKSTYTAGARIVGRNTYLELDAPSSTSSLTYKVQVQTDGSAGARFNPESGRSNITLIEVLA